MCSCPFCLSSTSPIKSSLCCYMITIRVTAPFVTSTAVTISDGNKIQLIKSPVQRLLLCSAAQCQYNLKNRNPKMDFFPQRGQKVTEMLASGSRSSHFLAQQQEAILKATHVVMTF